uniref:Uncharacterized protein n=1 Tax=Panagrolaimus superbus TaxID=310955 RepID=A0A914ZBE0_9BILA
MEKSGENLALVNNKLSIPPPPPAKDERKLSKMDTLISFLEIKKGDESLEAFWHSINDMKTFYFGLAVWCIGWNLAAVYISPTKWIQFIPLIILGIFFGFSGFHCRYV